MLNKKRLRKLFAVVMPVMMIVSMLLITAPSSASTSPPPLWGFKGAYANYTNNVTTNFPLPNSFANITPSWFSNNTYVNYTVKVGGVTTYSNVTVFDVNNTTHKFSTKTKTLSESYYVNGTSLTNLTLIGSPPVSGSLPALSPMTLYLFDSGMFNNVSINTTTKMTVDNNTTFSFGDKSFKSIKVTVNTTSNPSSNYSYYASYDTGVILNMSFKSGVIYTYVNINATNVVDPGHPPFPVGNISAISSARYEITAVAANGNFTYSVTGNNPFNFLSPGSPATTQSLNGTFSSPGFFAINETDLAQLNAGTVPSIAGIPKANITIQKDVTVTVPAGTFLTDKVHFSNSTANMSTNVTIYIDTTSGMNVLTTMILSGHFPGPSIKIYTKFSISLSSTNIPMAPVTDGYLSGNVSPSNATVMVNGEVLPVYKGHYNISLSPGTYYLSATMNGYQGKVYTETVFSGKTTQQNISLSAISNSVTLSGNVSPHNASVLVNGFMAYVNSTSGHYSISVTKGTYTVSVFDIGYFPLSRNINISASMSVNFTLTKMPAKTTSSVSKNNTTAYGFNVSVSNITTGKGLISVTFNATKNGTLLVYVPYSDVKNATLSDILNSSVYVNGVKDKNFSIIVTANYTVILKVYNLNGDPTLYWLLSPSAKLPPPTTPPPSTISPTLLEYGILAVLIIAIVAVVGLVVSRRKR